MIFRGKSVTLQKWLCPSEFMAHINNLFLLSNLATLISVNPSTYNANNGVTITSRFVFGVNDEKYVFKVHWW